jgi:hypothetical protein
MIKTAWLGGYPPHFPPSWVTPEKKKPRRLAPIEIRTIVADNPGIRRRDILSAIPDVGEKTISTAMTKQVALGYIRSTSAWERVVPSGRSTPTARWYPVVKCVIEGGNQVCEMGTKGCVVKNHAQPKK